MEFSTALLLGFLVILMISWTFREIRCIHYNFLCSLNGPKGLPVIGSLLPLLKSYNSPMKQYTSWAKQYGGLYKVKVGSELAVVVSDVDNFSKLFGKTGNKLNYRVRGNVLSLAMGNKGIATSDGKVWTDHRRFATKAFRDLSIGKSSTDSLIFTEVMRLVERIQTKIDQKFRLDGFYDGVETDLNISVFNILWHFVAGENDKQSASSSISFEDENIRKMLLGTRAQLKAAEQSGGWNFYTILQILWIIGANPLKLLPSYIRRILFVKKELQKISKDFKSSNDSDKLNLVRLYLKDISNSNEEHGLSLGNLEVFMSDFIVAGESLTSSIRWTLLYLASHPESMDKLRKELDEFLKHSNLSQLGNYSSRNELPYLEAVIAESLRICPVVHTIVHVTHEDICVADEFIPKETWVMGNIWGVNHDPKVFKDPDCFRPERFLEMKTADGKGTIKVFRRDLVDKCFNFSTGPRRCPGEQLSRMELHSFIAILVSLFDIQINPKKVKYFTFDPTVTLSLIPKDDYLIFKRR